MRLITRLTSLTTLTLWAALSAGCAGDAPRKPAADEKATVRNDDFYDSCYDAYARGAPTPVGCPPQQRGTYRRGTAVPSVGTPPLPDLPTRDVLGR